MNYIINELYGCSYLISALYACSNKEPPTPPPDPDYYFVLQTPNEYNPIEGTTTGTNKKNTEWLDTKQWNDSEYYYDEWYLDGIVIPPDPPDPQKYQVHYTYIDSPSNISTPEDAECVEGAIYYISTNIIPGTTVIEDGYIYTFEQYQSDGTEIFKGDNDSTYYFTMPSHDVTLVGTFEKVKEPSDMDISVSAHFNDTDDNTLPPP